MDTSKEYILMCKEAKEIQTEWSKTEELMELGRDGDYYYNTKGLINQVRIRGTQDDDDFPGDGITFPCETYGAIWLPRQDQLQDMVNLKIPRLVYDFRSFVADFIGSYTEKFGSMEQLWLAFVMAEKYNKEWHGLQWFLRR